MAKITVGRQLAAASDSVTVYQGTDPWRTESESDIAFSEKFDEQQITYVGVTDVIDTIVYKKASVVVATLQLSYDVNGNIVGVMRV